MPVPTHADPNTPLERKRNATTARPRCGKCLVHAPPLAHCVAALDYAFPWDHWLQALKFHARLEVLPLLGELLGGALARAHLQWPQLPPPDLVLPIPLSTERLRERGFNQSLEIARHLPTQRQYRLCAHTLVRVRHTGRQSDLPLVDRRGNLRAAFGVVRPVQGLRVALVDDVMTSGATLFEAAATLHEAGALAVQAWVVARTP
ncbi:ComF family protein [Roseateles sp. YR242]|uniref:ComF family protein n=1 Tax=Roseateles sp. YR242 TaxID=1855305 RepID=UPI000B805121|nr:ComF family protein [Roseateles sp. YR242]